MCPKYSYLGGFSVVPRFANDLWLEDIENGVCISQGDHQVDKFNNKFMRQDCHF